MDHNDKRIVRCLHCNWLTALPASLEPAIARELAEGLAKLHLFNTHHRWLGEGSGPEFEFVNLGDGPPRARLKVRKPTRARR